MTTITDSRLAVEKIDLAIIKLIEQRRDLCVHAKEQGEGLDLPDVLAESTAFWIEEAGDRALDEASAERVARLIARMCRAEDE